jgi:hypothetical protein
LVVSLTVGMVACVSKTTPKLSSIEITPSSPANIIVGSTLQLMASGKYPDGVTMDVTAKVNWESSSTGVIITGTGLVSAMEPGIVSVTANLDGITSPAIILVVGSVFQGSATGMWSGQMTIDTKTTLLSGTFSAYIDGNGAIVGTISGTYSGNMIGKVDLKGNLTGTGNLMVDSTAYVTTWTGSVVASGTSLNIQGTWTGQYNGSGTFSGNGTTSN